MRFPEWEGLSYSINEYLLSLFSAFPSGNPAVSVCTLLKIYSSQSLLILVSNLLVKGFQFFESGDLVRAAVDKRTWLTNERKRLVQCEAGF